MTFVIVLTVVCTVTTVDAVRCYVGLDQNIGEMTCPDSSPTCYKGIVTTNGEDVEARSCSMYHADGCETYSSSSTSIVVCYCNHDLCNGQAE